MDLTIDVTDVPGVAPGDVVTIYGRDGKDSIVARRGRRDGTVTSTFSVLWSPSPSLLRLVPKLPLTYLI